MYTAAEVLSMVGSIGILITALGAVVVNIIVAIRTSNKVDKTIKQNEDISNQVHGVHVLTNSNLSAVKNDLKVAVEQLSEMRILVTDLKSERDKLATLTALRTEVPTPSKLDEIAVNTKAIDENTKK